MQEVWQSEQERLERGMCREARARQQLLLQALRRDHLADTSILDFWPLDCEGMFVTPVPAALAN